MVQQVRNPETLEVTAGSRSEGASVLKAGTGPGQQGVLRLFGRNWYSFGFRWYFPRNEAALMADARTHLKNMSAEGFNAYVLAKKPGTRSMYGLGAVPRNAANRVVIAAASAVSGRILAETQGGGFVAIFALASDPHSQGSAELYWCLAYRDGQIVIGSDIVVSERDAEAWLRDVLPKCEKEDWIGLPLGAGFARPMGVPNIADTTAVAWELTHWLPAPGQKVRTLGSSFMTGKSWFLLAIVAVVLGWQVVGGRHVLQPKKPLRIAPPPAPVKPWLNAQPAGSFILACQAMEIIARPMVGGWRRDQLSCGSDSTTATYRPVSSSAGTKPFSSAPVDWFMSRWPVRGDRGIPVGLTQVSPENITVRISPPEGMGALRPPHADASGGDTELLDFETMRRRLYQLSMRMGGAIDELSPPATAATSAPGAAVAGSAAVGASDWSEVKFRLSTAGVQDLAALAGQLGASIPGVVITNIEISPPSVADGDKSTSSGASRNANSVSGVIYVHR